MLIDVCRTTICVILPLRHRVFKRTAPTLVSIHAAASGFVLTGNTEVEVNLLKPGVYAPSKVAR
jgi:hypothetical protein